MSKEISLKPIDDENYHVLRYWRNEHYDKFKQRRTFTYEEHSNWYEKVYKNKQRLGQEIMYVVEVDDELVGSLGITNIKDHEAEVSRVVSSLEHEGKGYMRDAMEKLIEGAVSTGMRRLYLDVLLDNIRAINFYKKLDFEEYKRDNESMYMELWLNRK